MYSISVLFCVALFIYFNFVLPFEGELKLYILAI